MKNTVGKCTTENVRQKKYDRKVRSEMYDRKCTTENDVRLKAYNMKHNVQLRNETEQKDRPS